MKRYFVLALLVALVVVVSGVGAAQRVAIRVSPVVAMEPALLTIRATVEPSEENRTLRVMIDSETYSTSSDIPLDGRSSPRLNVIEVRDVPSGLYEIRAIVSGASGPLGTTMQLVKIQPAPGRSR